MGSSVQRISASKTQEHTGWNKGVKLPSWCVVWQLALIQRSLCWFLFVFCLVFESRNLSVILVILGFCHFVIRDFNLLILTLDLPFLLFW